MRAAKLLKEKVNIFRNIGVLDVNFIKKDVETEPRCEDDKLIFQNKLVKINLWRSKYVFQRFREMG